MCLCLWPRSQRSGMNCSGSGNISGSIWVKEPALTTMERAGIRNPPITTSLSYTLRNVVSKIFTSLLSYISVPHLDVPQMAGRIRCDSICTAFMYFILANEDSVSDP